MTSGALENIPATLREIPHWVTWALRDGKKIPNAKVNDPTTWRSFADVEGTPINSQGGIGFCFNGDGIGGIDIDGGRNPETGVLTPWAADIVSKFSSYTEVSPSGTGVKIFLANFPEKFPISQFPMPGEPINGKRPAIEVYSSGRYFAVTGQRLPDSPTEIKSAPHAWLWLFEMVQSRSLATVKSHGGRNTALTKLAGAMRRQGADEDTIRTALLAQNQKFDPPLSEKEASQVAKSVSRYSPEEFVKNEKGAIVPNHQGNIQTALGQMGVTVSYNRFADRLLFKRESEPDHLLDEPALDRLWLEVDRQFNFRPTKDFFRIVVSDLARQNSFHPVSDYLGALHWDKQPRLDTWLVTYGGASDSEYSRAVGALVLIAAVRRVKHPGCKFDELLVLESPQGSLKSSALKRLCKDENWFSDDLPLDAESKIVIEKTQGKWILEAAELSGLKRSEVEHLKSFLSRQVDNARLAYDRLTTERARHFIVVGTTNSENYLKDSTGNRRFWPLRVGKFDLEKLEADRDQLWAEAVEREATGESIRLREELWPMAGVQQERRRVQHPWETLLEEVLGDMKGKVLVEAVWEIVGVQSGRRTHAQAVELGDVMKRLGFQKAKKSAGHDNPKWHWCRGTTEEQSHTIRVKFDSETGEVRATLE